MINKARELSVSNLQRLYTVVMSLAVAESLRRLLSDYGDKGQLPEFASVVAVFSLLITAIPFYHGANRYLEATYITGERKTKSQTLLFDFITLFVEGLIFFILAVVIKNTPVFYTTLAILFVLDSIWVGITYLTTIKEDKTKNIRAWAIANLTAAICVLIFVWSNLLRWSFWPSTIVMNVALGITTLARTIYDYYSTWDFYVPSAKKLSL